MTAFFIVTAVKNLKSHESFSVYLIFRIVPVTLSDNRGSNRRTSILDAAALPQVASTGDALA
jgi:hypothetical protein